MFRVVECLKVLEAKANPDACHRIDIYLVHHTIFFLRIIGTPTFRRNQTARLPCKVQQKMDGMVGTSLTPVIVVVLNQIIIIIIILPPTTLSF